MEEAGGQRGKLVAALVLGIIGGVFGILAALLAITTGGAFVNLLESEGGGMLVGMGYGAFVLALLGIVGGALSLAKPKAAAICLGIAGIGGFVAASVFWLLSGPLLIIGAILAWVGRPREAADTVTA